MVEKGKKAPLKTKNRERAASPGAKRLWMFRLIATVLVPLLLLSILEGGLRAAGYGYDPRFFKASTIEGGAFFVPNDAFSYRFFPRESARHPQAIRMKAVKPQEAIRVFVLGESAAMGDPSVAFGPARQMEVLLRARYPEVDFEFVNVAFTAISSHVILPIARECARHEGDLWIIYMGNNEMVGPFGASTIFGRQAPPLAQVRAALFVQRFRLGQLLHDGIQQLGGDPERMAGWGGMGMFVDNQVAPTDPKRDMIRTNFRGNLEDMVRLGAEADAGILLCTVAVNLRDSPPFASMQDPGLTSRAQGEFDTQLAEARAARAEARIRAAAGHYARAVETDPLFAAAHYEQASALLLQADSRTAKAAFQRACDTDALCFRTDAPLNEIIRSTAASNAENGVRLLDSEKELESLAEVPVLGTETFYEHVHFNFDGAYRMGLAWARAVEEMLARQLPPAPPGAWASRSECAARLGLTPWNRIMVLESMVKRLEEAPLSDQSNNEARIRLLEEEVARLRATLDAAAVADARKLFEEALTLTPQEPLLLGEQAKFLLAIGDPAGAVNAWQKAHALMPADPIPLLQLGILERRRGNADAAERHLRTALQLRPTLLQGWIELGIIFEGRQRWEDALTAFRRAAVIQPLDPNPWARQGRVLIAQAQTAQAIECYEQAIRVSPEYWEAHMALGDLHG